MKTKGQNATGQSQPATMYFGCRRGGFTVLSLSLLEVASQICLLHALCMSSSHCLPCPPCLRPEHESVHTNSCSIFKLLDFKERASLLFGRDHFLVLPALLATNLCSPPTMKWPTVPAGRVGWTHFLSTKAMTAPNSQLWTTAVWQAAIQQDVSCSKNRNQETRLCNTIVKSPVLSRIPRKMTVLSKEKSTRTWLCAVGGQARR